MATFNSAAKELTQRRTFDLCFTPYVQNGANLTNIQPAVRSYPNRAFTVYSGVQPTAQTVASDWASYKSTNSICLAHYNGANSTVALNFSYNDGTNSYYFTNPLSTVTVNALNTGTASWAIIWIYGTYPIDVSLSSIPANSKFIVVPVTDTSGIGVIRYSNLSATQGQPFVPYDAGLTLTGF